MVDPACPATSCPTDLGGVMVLGLDIRFGFACRVGARVVQCTRRMLLVPFRDTGLATYCTYSTSAPVARSTASGSLVLQHKHVSLIFRLVVFCDELLS